jgi:hypothetical protein
LHHVHALHDLAEDDVLAVEPVGLCGADKELRAVGVGTRVGLRARRRGEDAVRVGDLVAVIQGLGFGTERLVGENRASSRTMERTPGPVCLSLKFSSANFSP